MASESSHRIQYGCNVVYKPVENHGGEFGLRRPREECSDGTKGRAIPVLQMLPHDGSDR
jgi:hypothetical protein